jgi:hypothetical protein
MFAHRTPEHSGPAHWSGPTWEPTEPPQIGVPARSQPYYKLHGSSNWRAADGKRLLVAGGNKIRTIRSLEVLRLYLEEFERRLKIPETRLMVIGYGFRDGHINEAIKQATATSDLKLYIVDTRGTDAIEGLSFEDFVCGASRRPLSATFAVDAIEHAKVMKFFEGPRF